VATAAFIPTRMVKIARSATEGRRAGRIEMIADIYRGRRGPDRLVAMASGGLIVAARMAVIGALRPFTGPRRRTPCYPEPTPGAGINLDLIDYGLVSAPELKDGRGWCHAGSLCLHGSAAGRSQPSASTFI
jgi:hypothetical protein